MAWQFTYCGNITTDHAMKQLGSHYSKITHPEHAMKQLGSHYCKIAHPGYAINNDNIHRITVENSNLVQYT